MYWAVTKGKRWSESDESGWTKPRRHHLVEEPDVDRTLCGLTVELDFHGEVSTLAYKHPELWCGRCAGGAIIRGVDPASL